MPRSHHARMLLGGLTFVGLIAVAIGAAVWLKPANLEANDAPRPDLIWGASVIPYPTGVETQETVDTVMQRAVDLGLTVVRCEIPYGAWDDKERFRTVDAVVESANRHRLDVDLIIQPNWIPGEDIFANPELEQVAKDRATRAATHFKGKVRYYQLGNEIPTVSLKNSWSGARTDAYDDERYKKTLTWLAATGSTIRSIDPSAQLMTTANWLQYGFFERALKDGLDIDILGWDWFDEEQNIHQLTDEGQSIDLLTKLAQFGKPIWFVEAGFSASKHTEAEQADLNEAFARDLANHPAVKAIMIQVFIDQNHLIGTSGQYDGIIRLDNPRPGVYEIGGPKPAYDRLQSLIKEISG